MFSLLKEYCNSVIPMNEDELKLIDIYFKSETLEKRAFLTEQGSVCNFIAFIASGSVRHFHIKDGVEKTCDISFEGSWVTDFHSFTTGTSGVMNLQTAERTTVFIVDRENLYRLYNECPKYETFGRIMTELVAKRATEIAMSLSSEKPEERFIKLLQKHPQLFQRISQRYIASYLGVSPESLSRIRKRVMEKSKS